MSIGVMFQEYIWQESIAPCFLLFFSSEVCKWSIANSKMGWDFLCVLSVSAATFCFRPCWYAIWKGARSSVSGWILGPVPSFAGCQILVFLAKPTIARWPHPKVKWNQAKMVWTCWNTRVYPVIHFFIFVGEIWQIHSVSSSLKLLEPWSLLQPAAAMVPMRRLPRSAALAPALLQLVQHWRITGYVKIAI